jgi:hypothetical protein
MKLTINLANVTPRVDYASRIGGAALTKQATAIEAVQAENFKVLQQHVAEDVLSVFVQHSGDPKACANWVAEKLNTPVDLDLTTFPLPAGAFDWWDNPSPRKGF